MSSPETVAENHGMEMVKASDNSRFQIEEEDFESDEVVSQNPHEERLVAFYASNKTCLMFCVTIGLVTLILGLGLGLGLEGGSTSREEQVTTLYNKEKTAQYVDDLVSRISPPETINVYDEAKLPTTYQTKAIDRMKSDLFTLGQVHDGNPDIKVLRERYAIVAFYYATKGEGWGEKHKFLTSSHVCDWNGGTKYQLSDTITFSKRGIICDDSKNIISLVLRKFTHFFLDILHHGWYHG